MVEFIKMLEVGKGSDLLFFLPVIYKELGCETSGVG
jgi:hypothetical protein